MNTALLCGARGFHVSEDCPGILREHFCRRRQCQIHVEIEHRERCERDKRLNREAILYRYFEKSVTRANIRGVHSFLLSNKSSIDCAERDERLDREAIMYKILKSQSRISQSITFSGNH